MGTILATIMWMHGFGSDGGEAWRYLFTYPSYEACEENRQRLNGLGEVKVNGVNIRFHCVPASIDPRRR